MYSERFRNILFTELRWNFRERVPEGGQHTFARMNSGACEKQENERLQNEVDHMWMVSEGRKIHKPEFGGNFMMFAYPQRSSPGTLDSKVTKARYAAPTRSERSEVYV